MRCASVSVCSMLVVSIAMLGAAAPSAAESTMTRNPPATRFYVPDPDPAAIKQVLNLAFQGKVEDALHILEMVETPQAVWFNGGTPKSIRQDVRATVHRAAKRRSVPVLVAYNIPFRDCSQYSAGGATSVAEYQAWIDAFAAGIGNERAVVILEPDSIGIIPWYKQFRGLPSEAASYEWCQPAEGSSAVSADERFTMLNYAVDALKAKANVKVYLDGTHSGWLGSGDAAHRLVQAGVVRADGFYLNASNYQAQPQLEKYGTWISKCIWFGTQGSWGIDHFDWCASQYYPATAGDFATWPLSDQWYIDNVENQSWVPYPGDAGLQRFVVDTSRNGQGPWVAPADHPVGDPQDWCNPPGRGLGLRPTASTGNALIDAYLWIKIPGQSDGQCFRWTTGPLDPVRNVADPAAGLWFPDMALELTSNANPPLHF